MRATVLHFLRIAFLSLRRFLRSLCGSDSSPAFCIYFLSQFCDEWRLGRAAVLRWADDWYLPATRNCPPPCANCHRSWTSRSDLDAAEDPGAHLLAGTQSRSTRSGVTAVPRWAARREGGPPQGRLPGRRGRQGAGGRSGWPCPGFSGTLRIGSTGAVWSRRGPLTAVAWGGVVLRPQGGRQPELEDGRGQEPDKPARGSRSSDIRRTQPRDQVRLPSPAPTRYETITN